MLWTAAGWALGLPATLWSVAADGPAVHLPAAMAYLPPAGTALLLVCGACLGRANPLPGRLAGGAAIVCLVAWVVVAHAVLISRA